MTGHGSPARARPSWWLAALAVVAVYQSMWFARVADFNDLYWHVRMGQDILRAGRLTGDPAWTFGPVGDPGWVTTQAIPETALYLAWSTLGWQGIQFARLLAGAVFLAGVWWACQAVIPRGHRLAGRWRGGALAAIVGCLTAPSIIAERPQAVSGLILLPFGVVLLRLLVAGRWPHPLAVLAGTVAWGWMHGLALLAGPLFALAWGIRLVAAELTGRPLPQADGPHRWKPFAVLGAAVAGAAANPAGLEVFARASAIREAAEGFIGEWKPPPVGGATFLGFAVLAGAWAAAAIVLARRGAPARLLAVEGAWLVALAVVGISASRLMLVGLILALPVAARRLGQAWPAGKPGAPATPTGGHRVLATVLLAAVAVPPALLIASGDGLPAGTPKRILAGMASDGRANAAFIDWDLAGRVQVFGGDGTVTWLDGRADRYGAPVIDQYLRIVGMRAGWRQTWGPWAARTTDVVVSAESGFPSALVSDGWQVVCRDGNWVWLVAPGLPGRCPTRVDGPLPETGLR